MRVPLLGPCCFWRSPSRWRGHEEWTGSRRGPPGYAAICVLLLSLLGLSDSTLSVCLAQPFTFVVNSTADEADGIFGNGICDTAPPEDPPSGICTLRAALQETDDPDNAHPDNKIHFNISGAGVPTIRPRGILGSLGALRPVTIDGTTQPAGLVELDGSTAGLDPGGMELVGLEFVGEKGTVRGLVINRFGSDGIRIRPSGAPIVGSNVIEGCLIGTNPTGTMALPNGGEGVHIIDMPNNTIGPGNLISGNRENGVRIEGSSATLNKVVGNFIGTDKTGQAPLPNLKSGVVVENAADNTIGGPQAGLRNVISGNTDDGVHIEGTAATFNRVQGNFIGTNAAGTAALRNQTGVSIFEAPSNTIGGLGDAPGAPPGNVISGNRDGVVITQPSAMNNLVQGNLIGTNAAGTAVIPNTSLGVFIFDSPNNTIGGQAARPGAPPGNVISGNGTHGVQIQGDPEATNNFVRSNFIGTDVSGNNPLPNVENGVLINGGPGNSIGGPAPGAGNVISGNRANGVELRTANGNFVQGNVIGLAATGGPLPNMADGVLVIGNENRIGGPVVPPDMPGQPPGNLISGNVGSGVHLLNSAGNLLQGNRIRANSLHGVFVDNAPNNTIGGPIGDVGNVISTNNGNGVQLQGAFANGDLIRRNSIFDNVGLGIDLGADGVSGNDVGDGDAGPNTLQNFPELLLGLLDGTIIGSLSSLPTTQFTLDFYASTRCDPSGFGEGETFLGSANVTTDAGGNVNFTVGLAVVLPLGQFLTATATDLANFHTSEFSRCVLLIGSPPPCSTVVSNTNDTGDGSFRSAILCANATAGADTITFNIPGAGVRTITPASALPAITDPAIVDGFSQPGSSPNTNPPGLPSNAVLAIELDGSSAGAGVDGLRITAGNSTVRGLVIDRFGGHGILLQAGGGNLIEGNLIGTDASGAALGNGGAGVLVAGGTGNRIHANSIFSNGTLGIDLDADGVPPPDGVTPNDPVDPDAGSNDLQNFPVLTLAAIRAGAAAVEGTLNSATNCSYTLEFFSSPACDPSGHGEGRNLLATAVVATNGTGDASFTVPLPGPPAPGGFITATATAPNGSTSEFSACVSILVATDYYTIIPCRIVDTRALPGPYGGPALAAGSERVFSIGGQCGIPSDAHAVAFNATVTQAAAQGHLGFHAADVALPVVSTINYGPNQTRANNGITPLSAAGEVAVLCVQASGTVHFVLDAVGYFK